MTYLLDTVTVIAILNKHPEARKNHLKAKALRKTINVGGISCYEIKRGFLSCSNVTQEELLAKFDKFDLFSNECKILLFNNINVFDNAAELWASLPKGGKIGDNDLLTAALAKTHNLVLVTNDSDFARLDKGIGVQIEDWK